MNEIFWALLLPSVAWIIHFIIWKIRLPQRQTRALLIIFLSVFLVAGAIYPGPFSSLVMISFVHLSAMAAYVITYSAVEVDSPSLLIIKLIANRSLTEAELHGILDDKILILPRLQDLVRDRHLIFSDGKYHLTGKGLALASIFIKFRTVLGAAKGG